MAPPLLLHFVSPSGSACHSLAAQTITSDCQITSPKMPQFITSSPCWARKTQRQGTVRCCRCCPVPSHPHRPALHCAAGGAFGPLCTAQRSHGLLQCRGHGKSGEWTRTAECGRFCGGFRETWGVGVRLTVCTEWTGVTHPQASTTSLLLGRDQCLCHCSDGNWAR
jgi:hypothetical protein